MINLISHWDFEDCNHDMEMKLLTTACSASVCLESRMLLIQVLELVETNRKFIKTFFFCFVYFSHLYTFCFLQKCFNNTTSGISEEMQSCCWKMVVSLFHLGVPSSLISSYNFRSSVCMVLLQRIEANIIYRFFCCSEKSTLPYTIERLLTTQLFAAL